MSIGTKLSHFWDKFKSTQDVGSRIKRRLEQTRSATDLNDEFMYGCVFFCKNAMWNMLAEIIRDYGQKPQVQNCNVSKSIMAHIEVAANGLKLAEFLPEAISLCSIFGLQDKSNELRFEYLLTIGSLEAATDLLDAFSADSKKIKKNQIEEFAGRLFEEHLRHQRFEQAIETANFCRDAASMINRVVEAARQYVVDLSRSQQPLDVIQNFYRRLASIEATAGNFIQAGKIAEEILKDYSWAIDLYEKANLYHLAIAIASKTDILKNDNEIKRKLAGLHKRGGNLLEAAKLYEELQEYDEAAPIYEELEQYKKALACYWKLGDAGREHVIDLSCKCGLAKDACELLLASNKIADIERAIGIAKTYQLPRQEQKAKEILSRLQHGCIKEAKALIGKIDDELSETYSPILGIDFGTTNSVGAVYNKKTHTTEIIPAPGSSDGVCEPSCWGIDEQGNILYGEAARRHGIVNAGDVVFCSKRMLGGNKNAITLKGRKYRPEEIAAAIIDHVAQNAINYLQSWRENRLRELLSQRNMSLSKESTCRLIEETKPKDLFKKTVLTVPAFYDNNRKQATRIAAEIAGLEVVRLMHEPTAAALKHFIGKSTNNQKVVVVDLGGGTLDLSFLEIGDGVYDVVSVNGDIQLGGKDIDDLLVDYAINDIGTRYNIDLKDKKYTNDCARLRDGCENLKIQLSATSKYTMVLPYFLNITEYQLDLTRQQLESIIQPFLSKFQSVLKKAFAEEKANGFCPEQVVLVGNATRMPAIERIVSQVFGRDVKSSNEAGTIVASGAALQGAILSRDLSNVLLLDVLPYSLNIVVKDHDSEKLVCHRMIDRNTTIPVSKKDTFSTTSDNQTSVRIVINQGESSSPNENYPLGSVLLRDIPFAPAGVPKISVNYSIDVDCILCVTAQDEATGKEVSIRIENTVLLSPAERAEMHSFFEAHKRETNDRDILNSLTNEIRGLIIKFERIQKQFDQNSNDFKALFKERVEQHPEMYSASKETFASIQEMFFGMDNILRERTRLSDQIASIRHHLDENNHANMSDKDAFQFLTKAKEDLKTLIASFQKDVLGKCQDWNSILRGMKLNISKLSTSEAARALMISGDEQQAKILWEQILVEKGIDSEAFQMLLRCDVKTGEFSDYREHHRKYGKKHGMIYPDFDYLDTYLNSIRDTIFLVVCTTGDMTSTGTAFAIGSHWLATCRHVVEGATAKDVRFFGNGHELSALEIKWSDRYDIAIIRVAEEVKTLRMGEFSTASPGESILAVGFPHPDSLSFEENLSISRGVINSVRQSKDGRMIFMDAKISGGNSGGPLLNSLGEVIGINTFIIRHFNKDAEGLTYTDFEQPVAIPVWHMRSWIEQNMM